MKPTRLNPHDAKHYRALMLEAYERHPDAFTSSVAERAALPLSWWEARLKDEPAPPEAVFGIRMDGGLAGVVGISFETREKVRHKATLFGMYVPERFRKHGHGKRLIGEALLYAKSRPGVRVVQLTVTSGNFAAQALYENSGFVQFGLEPFAAAVGVRYVEKKHMWHDLDNIPDYVW
ncbi:GNAT family N-acetyltransferase [Herbaspirillum sp. HC18]|nr:GNAT family N-acetyltransferase [Herbaspirillum sp. HC18]